MKSSSMNRLKAQFWGAGLALLGTTMMFDLESKVQNDPCGRIRGYLNPDSCGRTITYLIPDPGNDQTKPMLL
jgi:hypothetical protein